MDHRAAERPRDETLPPRAERDREPEFARLSPAQSVVANRSWQPGLQPYDQFFVCHCQAELIIVDRSACCGCQPRTDRAFEESATRCEGSPARRPSISIGIYCCVILRAALMTSS